MPLKPLELSEMTPEESRLISGAALMSRGGHPGYSVSIRPGGLTWDVILRRTMSM